MEVYEIVKILGHADHTLLQQTATWEEIRGICDDALRYRTASVCIPPSYVRQAADYLKGRIPVCTVIGFPNGYSTTKVKECETLDAIANGADEIDMVINLGWVKDGRFDLIEQEIRTLKAACGERILKVIIETCLLNDEEKIRMCEAVTAAGADYIKTSTGFSKGGATPEDVALFAAHIGPGVRIKAAGGISTLEDAAHFLELGADRLGTSRVVKIVKGKDSIFSKYHIFPGMNDDRVLSLFSKKPMDFDRKNVDEEELSRQIAEVESDFACKFRKVVKRTQVHGDTVEIITEENLDAESSSADALLTDLKGVALEIRTADCQSIFLYDPVKEVIGNVHSGWRGTLLGIAVKAVRMMESRYGSKPEDIRAYINPSILGCSFEVEDDVLQQFGAVLDVSKYSKKGRVAEGKQKYLMDTAAINRDALEAAGLLPENIALSGVCTFCSHEEYHSYRADGHADGRNGALICLR